MMLKVYDRVAAQELEIDWPDVYFSPEFGAIAEVSDGGKWQVAIWNDGEIIYPFLRRAIGETGNEDILSPYGYAGIFGNPSTTIDSLKEFRTAFRGWAVSEGIIAEFIRMSNILSEQSQVGEADDALNVVPHNETILLNMNQDHEQFFAQMEGRSRTNVRKSKKLGYTVEIAPTDAAFFQSGSDFRRLYNETMVRVSAVPYYHFSDAYFDAFHEFLGDHTYSVIARNQDGETAMVALFFLGRNFLHSHLLGSLPQALRDGVGNFLYDEVAKFGCNHPDINWMHLGGGQSANDALYKFKKSFGGQPTPYYLGRAILDSNRYEELVAARAADLGCSVDDLHETEFFPAYRASL